MAAWSSWPPGCAANELPARCSMFAGPDQRRCASACSPPRLPSEIWPCWRCVLLLGQGPTPQPSTTAPAHSLVAPEERADVNSSPVRGACSCVGSDSGVPGSGDAGNRGSAGQPFTTGADTAAGVAAGQGAAHASALRHPAFASWTTTGTSCPPTQRPSSATLRSTGCFGCTRERHLASNGDPAAWLSHARRTCALTPELAYPALLS